MVDKSMHLRANHLAKRQLGTGEVLSTLTHLKVVLELEGCQVSMALLLKVARGYTERQIGLNSTKLLKKMDIGGTNLNIKHQVQVINISIEPLVKL